VKVTVASSVPTVLDVRVTVPAAFVMLRMSPEAGLAEVLFAPHATAVVKTTGENRGSEDFGSPPSGASMIHSTDWPLNDAPGGGASVMEKCWVVSLLAK
jgi:hypothetical protein